MASAQSATEVALAGFAYSGAADTVGERFPYSVRYEEEQKASGSPLGQQLFHALNATPPQHFKLVPQLEALNDRTQAVAVALVINSETVSVEQFDSVHKLMVLIRGQAMFFDFKSMNVLRSYPISFAYVDALDHAPSPDEVMARVRLVYQGANNKPGLNARFTHSVQQASLPQHVPRYLQVTTANVSEQALAFLPPYLQANPLAAQTWAADLVSEAISTRAGVPIIPYAKGYAVGNVMSMRVSDGRVWELQLPKPDYEIRVDFTEFKKIKFAEVAGGASSFVYGAYANIQIEEPLSGKRYLDTALKNGETRVIPASQLHVDDFPHFYDAANGMFVKLAQIMGGQGEPQWLKRAAAAPNIDQQIASSQTLIQQSK